MFDPATESFAKKTKNQVRAALRKNGVWRGFLCPSNCYPNPGHPFNLGLEVHLTKDMLEYGDTDEVVTRLDKVLNAFQYYNCTAETGNKIHYYEITEDDSDDAAIQTNDE